MTNQNKECQVTHQHHKEGIRDMRRTQFYKTLTQCIEYKEEEEDDQ